MYTQTSPNWVVVSRPGIRSRLCLKLAHPSIFRCPLINQIPLLLFCFIAASVFPSLVPVHTSVSAVAEMFPISCMTTDVERKWERGWILATTADLPVLIPPRVFFFLVTRHFHLNLLFYFLPYSHLSYLSFLPLFFTCVDFWLSNVLSKWIVLTYSSLQICSYNLISAWS